MALGSQLFSKCKESIYNGTIEELRDTAKDVDMTMDSTLTPQIDCAHALKNLHCHVIDKEVIGLTGYFYSHLFNIWTLSPRVPRPNLKEMSIIWSVISV